MKLKFDWGTGIFIFIIIFLLSMVFAIQFAFKQKINLVAKDYYPRELEYQSIIEKKKNVEKYKMQIRVEEQASKVVLHFPDSIKAADCRGKILFYRPSDFEKDIEFDLLPGQNLEQQINTANLIKGKWNLIIDWKLDTVEYYQETTIYIQ